ncbi:MAG: hypothetical protein JWQ87_1873 [Candidatus Sulfotelmatobacter sp.]|nr:hypothetical protein [Candidatus Sulfotelmatobacter sp.]
MLWVLMPLVSHFGTEMLVHTTGTWPWVKEWSPYALPAVVNLVMVAAGILLSFEKWTKYIDDHSTLRWVCAVVFIVLGALGFGFDVSERHQNDKTTKVLLQDVRTALENTKLELQKTEVLLTKITTVEVGVSLMPALDAKITNIQNQISAANNAHDTVREAKLNEELSEALKAKILLSKQVISNARLVVLQLRDTARNWSSEEAHAKDDKERDRIHGEWNQRHPLGNARPATLQLLALLPETLDRSKEIQWQDMKFHGQAFGGTGPGPIQEDADYLEALIKQVIATNPELAK